MPTDSKKIYLPIKADRISAVIGLFWRNFLVPFPFVADGQFPEVFVQAVPSSFDKTSYGLGWQSQSQELARQLLPVQGTLPAWLRGRLVRTVPSLFEIGQTKLTHWFDGLASLYALEFAQNEIYCQSRLLASQAYQQSLRSQKLTTAEFATNPCLSLAERIQAMVTPPLTDNGNVNVARVGSHCIALTEIPKFVEFNPSTLETIGRLKCTPALGLTTATAHPHIDSTGNVLINVGTRLGPRCSYVVYEILPDARQRQIAAIAVDKPGYIHSFALTDNYVTIVESPLVVNAIELLLSGKPYIENFHWQPDRDARILIVHRGQRRLVSTVSVPAFFSFHHVNAFEQAGGDLVLDLVAYPDAGIVQALYLAHLRSNQSVPGGQLVRYNIKIADQAAERTLLSPQELELPRINYTSRNKNPYHQVWCASKSTGAGFLDQLIKIDLSNGSDKIWMEPGCFPGEPVFVGEPGATGEDRGVVLSLVLEPAAGRSFLLILDAQSMHELARAPLPVPVPFGFHGQFWSIEGEKL